jgi:DNA-binding NarL/FixJ family response regulator
MTDLDHPAEILIVASDLVSARLIAGTLEPAGLRRTTCVCGEREALAAVEAFRFDAAIIDIELPDGDGLNVVWGIQSAPSPCSAVIVGEDVDAAAVREALMVGVCACLRRPLRPDLLRAATLHAVACTWLWLRCIDAAPDPRGDAHRAARRLPPTIGARDVREAHLTTREQEVLKLLLEGQSNSRMATSLGVTTRTVKYHVGNVLRKLGARSRISLLASYNQTVGRGSSSGRTPS